MKTIGLIGGLSWESTASYYRMINEGVRERRGGLSSAKLVLTSVNFAEVALLQSQGAWDALTSIMIMEARRLENAGCDAIFICTNTMHKLYEPIQEAVHIPIMHICDAIGKHAKASGMQQLALTGTRFTMEESFYRDHLKKQFGLAVTIPEEKERLETHRVIFENLCRGIVKKEEANWFANLHNKLLSQGCDAIILGCTELAMLCEKSLHKPYLLDTTTLHAKAAVDFALGEKL